MSKQVISHKRDHMIIHVVVSMLLLSSGSSSSMHDSKLPSVRENQEESGNFKVHFSNQGKSGKMKLF